MGRLLTLQQLVKVRKLKGTTHYATCSRKILPQAACRTKQQMYRQFSAAGMPHGQVGIEQFCMIGKATSIVRDGRLFT